jgi:hypothetical protein
MAMALHTHVQGKAQVELDRVLDGRLPEFNDRPNLPYINALVKESMRWQVVAPLGKPLSCIPPCSEILQPAAASHVSVNDDEYNGYFIPKGTIVMGNAWCDIGFIH